MKIPSVFVPENEHLEKKTEQLFEKPKITMPEQEPVVKLSKNKLESICEIALGSFHGLMCKYLIDGFLYYYPIAVNNPNNFENAGDAAGCLFLAMVAGGVSGALCYDGIRKLYKSIKTGGIKK